MSATTPTLDRTVFWAPWSGPGLELLRLRAAEGGYVGSGTVLGLSDGKPFRLYYKIKCDADWHTRKVMLELLAPAGDAMVTLRSDGKGNWKDDRGEPIAALAGCLDVDISSTPFTNTLPIRRLKQKPGQQAMLKVAYVATPVLKIRSDEQRYNCVDRSAGGGRVSFEAPQHSFRAELPFDTDGLVLDYPELFRRVFPL